MVQTRYFILLSNRGLERIGEAGKEKIILRREAIFINKGSV